MLGIAPSTRDAAAPRAPGTLAAHYAPRTALALVDARALSAEVAKASDIAVLALRGKPAAARVACWIAAPADPMRSAHELYASLRAPDRVGARGILVEAPPDRPGWDAVNDRLGRAAAGGGAMDDQP